MANLEDSIQKGLFDLTGNDYGHVISQAGKIYGTISGAYAYYQAGKSVLTALGILDSPESPFEKIHEELAVIQQKLDNILSTLEQARLEQAEATSHITRTTITNSESTVKSAAYNAYSYLKNPTPDNRSLFEETRDEAHEAINYFKDNPYYWKRIHLDQMDYKDEWSGTLSPPTEQRGLWVWDFIVTLPAYLSALANWCVVVLASDDGFKEAHLTGGVEIQKHIDFLHGEVLCKILASFEPIKAPTFEQMKYLPFATTNDKFYMIHINGGKIYFNQETINNLLRVIPGGKWRLIGYQLGMVEKYTGWTSLCAFPTEEIRQATAWLHFEGSFWIVPDGSPESLFTPTGAGATVTINNQEEYQKFYDRFLLRHTIRTWEQARKLSAKLGLPAVRKCITDLCTMRNRAPHALPPEWNRYVMMSMRELWSVVPDSLRASVGPVGRGSMRKLAEFAGVQQPITLRRIFFLDS
ncbi:MAG: hypothetical protein D3904_00650 [Candidatus Electrothrix sp. EH2]|nr:hypothetical protein [Candidatus Electrothrix sp. EH2]